MDMPFPRTPWEKNSKVNMLNLWTSKNPNLLVGVNLDIGSAVNREHLIKVIHFLYLFLDEKRIRERRVRRVNQGLRNEF